MRPRRSRPTLPIALLAALVALMLYWQRVIAQPNHACEEGLASACTRLGYDLEEGRGFNRPPDFQGAADAFLKGCEAGDLDGCLFLGKMYERAHGEGSAPDLYAFGCQQGKMGLCDAWAVTLDAEGDPRAAEMAAGLQRHACRAGLTDACRRLARRHISGRGVRADPGEAMRLAALGCTRGEPMACLDLSEHHRRGFGVPQDEGAAGRYRRAACAIATFGGHTPRHRETLAELACGEAPLDAEVTPPASPHPP